MIILFSVFPSFAQPGHNQVLRLIGTNLYDLQYVIQQPTVVGTVIQTNNEIGVLVSNSIYSVQIDTTLVDNMLLYGSTEEQRRAAGARRMADQPISAGQFYALPQDYRLLFKRVHVKQFYLLTNCPSYLNIPGKSISIRAEKMGYAPLHSGPAAIPIYDCGSPFTGEIEDYNWLYIPTSTNILKRQIIHPKR